jgi:hypothetical protein
MLPGVVLRHESINATGDPFVTLQAIKPATLIGPPR